MEIIFKYDEQTFRNLEILKGHQDASVFTIFNNTLTEGGAGFLKQLFRHPITVWRNLKDVVNSFNSSLISQFNLPFLPDN